MVARGVVAHAIVTDPPYELTRAREANVGMAGQRWDSRGIAFDPETWRSCLDLLPPGGHVAAFGSPRTYHRLACAIEDAGFEVRDQLMWLHSTAFPKSRDVSKAIDALGGLDGVTVRREIAASIEASELSDGEIGRLIGRSSNLVKAWRRRTRNISAGDAAKLRNVLGCRVPDVAPREVVDEGKSGMGGPDAVLHSATAGPRAFKHRAAYHVTAAATEDAKAWEGWGTALKPAHEPIVLARKPLDGSVAVNVLEHSTGAVNVKAALAEGDRWPANVAHDGTVLGEGGRFYYCAKASKEERRGSRHPTVKPVPLLRWLVRMVTPPRGTVVDPFAGTGTTGEAAFLEGFNCVLIEREPEYQADIARRMEALSA